MSIIAVSSIASIVHTNVGQEKFVQKNQFFEKISQLRLHMVWSGDNTSNVVLVMK